MSLTQNTTAETLPTWNLSDLYAALDDPAIKHDLTTAQQKATAFAQKYKGNLHQATAATIAAAIQEYEAIEEILGKVLTYAYLCYAGDTSNPQHGKLFQDCQESANASSRLLVFFTLEIAHIEENTIQQWYAENATVARYKPWLEDIRLFKPYQLSEQLEEILHEKHVTGKASWNRLFDETMASLRFPYRGDMLTETEILHIVSSSKDTAERKEAALAFGAVLQKNGKLFALITNTLAKDKEIEDRWRGYPSPLSARNLSNQVEDSVVTALVETVKAAYPRLSHRYYALKAKWLGVSALDFWDRNAPLPEQDDRIIPWQDAQNMVLEAYMQFSPKLGEIGKTFFDKNWIDVPPRAGKDSGAFAHPCVPSVHPYLMLNYKGKTRDVMTLAHELGHGVHQVLAAKQGMLLADTPLTLAETASVFGEMLTFRSLLAQTSNPAHRKALLAKKVEDMLNTVVRQIAFHTFEVEVHHRRKQGELSEEVLGDIWMETQQQSFGSAIRLEDTYRSYWSYIPHFIHSPFYVYAYAFGDCLVNSLYAVYEQSEAGFAEKYLEMLQAGGTKRHKELLAPFGLDASDPDFWNKGLAMIEGFIEELEKL